MEKGKIKKLVVISLIVVGVLIVLLFYLIRSRTIIMDEEDYLTKLKELNKYSTDITMTFKNDRVTDVYKGKLVFSREKGYILELDNGRRMIFNSDEIKIKDSITGDEYVRKTENDKIHKFIFLEEYIKLLYTDQKLNFTMQQENETEYLIIHLKINEENDNMKTASLWVDKGKVEPKKIVVYNKDNKESISIEYRNFDKNYNDEETVFQ
ncbi:germination lipoprotein GerS-related protein [uncultured Clostridium sp.]|uniref:germination lipoprotein GerS-related protein n=1 Tax=uncultured Clostridium sp. TaxID=59620 RepID=UPI0025FA92CC|nr:germination lipoprotein GerS-related protein [uncultured Clostridium sp.]